MSRVAGIRVGMRKMMKEVSSKDEDEISLLTAVLCVHSIKKNARRPNYATAHTN